MKMAETLQRTSLSSLTRVWIPVGSVLFMVALIGSAAVVPQLRPLHFFQALIYVAVIILALRNSAWGYGAGVSVPAYWNGLQLFVTHNFQTGARLIWSFLHTGQLRRFDTMMVPLGGIGHFILIIACLGAIFGKKSDKKKWWKFLGGAVGCLAYFALIILFLLPRP